MCDDKCVPKLGANGMAEFREQGTEWKRNWGKFHRSCNESCIKTSKFFPSGVKERHYALKKKEYVEKRGVKGFGGLFS